MQLSVASQGPLMLVFTAPEVPLSTMPWTVSIGTDRMPPQDYRALGAGHALSVEIVQDLEEALWPARSVRLTFRGETYAFDLGNLREAIEAVSRCAGMPDHARRMRDQAQPIAGAVLWDLTDSERGFEGCVAAMRGDSLMIQLAVDAHARPILAASPIWSPGISQIMLGIDADEPIATPAEDVDMVVLVPIGDHAALRRLRTAKQLVLRLPSVGFRADVPVDGLDAALDAVTACNARRHAGARPQ